MSKFPYFSRLFFALAMVLGLALSAGGAMPASTLAASIDCALATPVAAAAAASPTVASSEATPPAAFPDSGGALTVYAAASLTASYTKMGKDLEAAHPGLKIAFNFAGSQDLVSQLQQGAKADVLATASVKTMAAAIKNGSIDGSSTLFTQNRLTIVVPKDNPAGIKSAADLSKAGVKLVLAAVAVPVGQYAHDSICKMGLDEKTYGAKFAAKVASNIASEEDNVKAVLAKVQTGEADAGIVYTTDVTATAARDVKEFAIPAKVNVIAKYPIAAVKGGNSALAQAFIGYVLGPDGQATLKSFHFEPKP